MWVNNIHWAWLKKDHSNRWTLDIPPRQITDDLQIRKTKIPVKRNVSAKNEVVFLIVDIDWRVYVRYKFAVSTF